VVSDRRRSVRLSSRSDRAPVVSTRRSAALAELARVACRGPNRSTRPRHSLRPRSWATAAEGPYNSREMLKALEAIRLEGGGVRQIPLFPLPTIPFRPMLPPLTHFPTPTPPPFILSPTPLSTIHPLFPPGPPATHPDQAPPALLFIVHRPPPDPLPSTTSANSPSLHLLHPSFPLISHPQHPPPLVPPTPPSFPRFQTAYTTPLCHPVVRFRPHPVPVSPVHYQMIRIAMHPSFPTSLMSPYNQPCFLCAPRPCTPYPPRKCSHREYELTERPPRNRTSLLTQGKRRKTVH